MGKINRPGAWEPGESGNPNGRPPDDNSWSGIIRRVGAEVVDGKTRKQHIVEYLYRYIADQAGKPDEESNITAALKAINYLSDRDEGKPAQAVTLTGNEGGPLDVNVNFRGVGDD